MLLIIIRKIKNHHWSQELLEKKDPISRGVKKNNKKLTVLVKPDFHGYCIC